MKRSFSKENKGITLIALVVTIVVLIILSVISVNVVIGEDGIIKKAEKAKSVQSHGEVNEAVRLSYVDYQFSIKTKEREGTYKAYLVEKGYADENGKINVENLLGKNVGLGNGTENKDVYKMEELEDKYEHRYNQG